MRRHGHYRTNEPPAPLGRRIWAAIARFAFRRAIKPGRGKEPAGLPGRRDPESKCAYYDPRRKPGDESFGDCETDGHYLCSECVWISRGALVDRGLLKGDDDTDL